MQLKTLSFYLYSRNLKVDKLCLLDNVALNALLSWPLKDCQAGEIDHLNEDAASRGSLKIGFILRIWCETVFWGSRNALAVCRHF